MIEDNEQNTVLNFQGSYQDFDTILTLFLSGELEQQLGISILDVSATSQYQPTAIKSVAINLSQWFQRVLPKGWEYEPILLGSFLAQQMNPAYGNRTGTDAIAQRTVLELINLLHSESEEFRFQAAVELIERQEASPAIITALVDGLLTSDPLTVWQLGLTLGRIAPDHPKAAIAQRQEITVGSLRLEILIALRKHDSDNTDVLLQLYSTEDYHLPAELKLSIINESGEVAMEQKADRHTSCLSVQLSVSLGQEFTVQISWDQHQLEKHFVA